MSRRGRNDCTANLRSLTNRRFVFVRHARALKYAHEIVSSVAVVATHSPAQSMSILQSWIARKLCVGQTRAAEKELIGANRVRREKIVRAGGAGDVVLIDTVAADADRADQHAVSIKAKRSRENGDAVWKIGIRHETRIRCDGERIAG